MAKQTDIQWTTKVPTEPGSYWFYGSYGCTYVDHIVEVYKTDSTILYYLLGLRRKPKYFRGIFSAIEKPDVPTWFTGLQQEFGS